MQLLNLTFSILEKRKLSGSTGFCTVVKMIYVVVLSKEIVMLSGQGRGALLISEAVSFLRNCGQRQQARETAIK